MAEKHVSEPNKKGVATLDWGTLRVQMRDSKESTAKSRETGEITATKTPISNIMEPSQSPLKIYYFSQVFSFVFYLLKATKLYYLSILFSYFCSNATYEKIRHYSGDTFEISKTSHYLPNMELSHHNINKVTIKNSFPGQPYDDSWGQFVDFTD